MTYTIFGDNLVEIHWFEQLSPLLKNARLQKIGPRGANPVAIEDLIRYDRPDIILLAGTKPVLVVEKTREVPTGHNVGQRIARLVRAVEAGIPTIKFFPFDARKHGDYSSVCNLNIRLLAAFKRMLEIHETPILAVNWPADKHYELVDDGSEDLRIGAIVHDYLSSGHNPRCREILGQLKIMEEEYLARLGRYPSYADFPGSSVFQLQTVRVLNGVAGDVRGDADESFKGRAKTLIYRMNMSPTKCRREDPYTGTQFIYDYIWCRSGPKPSAKHTNLVLQFPLLSRSQWYSANPNDTTRKSCNWYLVASALWFKDGLDMLQ